VEVTKLQTLETSLELLTSAVRRGKPAAAAETILPARRIHIERLILHSLNNLTGEIQLVDEVAMVSAEVEAFFSVHIEAALLRADWQARFSEPSGEVASLCRELLGTPEQYVKASRQLALRLFTQMRPRTIAPGDFVALIYRRGDEPHQQIALLKLDPDHRLVRTFEVREGHLRVFISVAENLLPDSARLQKCALLTCPTPGADFEVTLLDTQAGPRAEGIAAFFYRGFLATELAPSARRRTREFLRCCDLWLTAHQEDFSPPQVTAFYEARRVALDAQYLDCAAFVERALPAHAELGESLRGILSTWLAGAITSEAAPAGEFEIDHGVADPFIARVTLELDGGARLTVPATRFFELVQIEPDRTAENKYRLIIESSTLKEVSDR
jgi:hypothetical protein